MAEGELSKPEGQDGELDADPGPLFNTQIMLRIAILMAVCVFLALVGCVMAVMGRMS